MGIVYLAEQTMPFRRQVALKVVKPLGQHSAHLLARFAAERQTLATLNHTGISKMFDAGATEDGRPYVAMEYVDGLPLIRFCDQHRLSITDRLHLFLQVCAAVQHAHQKGVIHRDIKPSNLLVGYVDDRPAVKVIDFGIAKALQPSTDEETFLTQTGAILGTPEYMSPEQVTSGGDVDTRTDVYALGVVLYELLIGVRPFEVARQRGSNPLTLLQEVREQDPPRLSTRLRALDDKAAATAASRRTDVRSLARHVRGELEWMTLRALEKLPAQRYQSAAELGADVERHLKGEPVLANPPSTMYRLRKFARRHRALVAALGVVVIALIVSAVISTVSLVRALRAEDRTRRQLIGSLVVQGMQKVDAHDSLTGLVYLVRALELERDDDRTRGHRMRIGETLRHSPQLVDLWRHEAPINMLALSARGQVATGSADGLIRIRDLATRVERSVRLDGAIIDGEFSRDGAMLAAGSNAGRIRVWHVSDLRLGAEFGENRRLVDLALSPDASLVAAMFEDGVVRAWDLAGASRLEWQHEGPGRRIAFSQSGALLATAGGRDVRIWQMPSGRPSGPVLPHDRVTDLAFAESDELLATAGVDFGVRLWNLPEGRQVGEPMRHDGAITSVTFADAARLLVTTGNDHATRVWRVADRSPVGLPRISGSITQRPAVGPDLVIASPTQSGLVDLWSVQGERAGPSVPHGSTALVRFDGSGRFLIAAGSDGLARRWDLTPAMNPLPRIEPEAPEFSWRVVASPDGRTLGVSSGGLPDRSSTRLFDLQRGAPVTPTMRCPGLNHSIAFSPEGQRVLTACGGGEIRLWDVRTGEPVTEPLAEEMPLRSAAFSPDGRLFVVAGGTELGSSGAARVRSAADGGAQTPLLRHDGMVTEAWFSPDGHRLLTVDIGVGRNVRMWDVASGRLLWSAAHDGGAPLARWTRDGTLIFSGGFDQRVRAWDSRSGHPGGLPLKMLGGVSSLGLSSDASRLVAGTAGGDIRLTTIAPDGGPAAVMGHKGFVYQSVFSPDGSLILTAAGDQTARLWDGFTGEPLTPNLGARSISRSATFLKWGRSWAWTGGGVFVDDLLVERRSLGELRAIVESAAGRTLSATGSEIPLSAEDIEARHATTAPRGGEPVAASSDYLRRRAHAAWSRRRFADVAPHLAPIVARGDWIWSDVMRLLGAHAATNRWRDALDELGRHRSRWPAAPELFYMEAVALSRAGDQTAAVGHCRAVLAATRGTHHPERAYWAARACLVQASLADDDRAAVAERVQLANLHMYHDLGRTDLNCALLLRTHRPAEAFNCLRAAMSVDSPVHPAVLLMAAAAAHAGRPADARAWLSRADAVRRPIVKRFLDVWIEAEGDALRQEVLSVLRPGERRLPGHVGARLPPAPPE